MGLLDRIKNQLAKVISWDNQDQEVLWYQFPSKDDEVKNASKLIVAPGQGCVLVYEGKIVDVLQEEGIFTLATDNNPFITTLLKIRQGFESEHKLKIFFFRTAQVVNQSWGTSNPIKFVDNVYGFPVEMGANGNFSYQIKDVEFLFRDIIGNESVYTTFDLRTVLINRIPETMTTYLANMRYSYQEVDSHLSELSVTIQELLQESVFLNLGIELVDFKISGKLFDDATKNRIAKIADISSDVTAASIAGLSYVELEKLKALRDAARNEGGLSGAGLQMGVGMELGRKFNEEKDAVFGASDDVVEKLRKLKVLQQEEIITSEEFEAMKKELLSKL